MGMGVRILNSNSGGVNAFRFSALLKKSNTTSSGLLIMVIVSSICGFIFGFDAYLNHQYN
jgi:hypothetical protein